MGPIELLSEAVINTLKEFSMEKRPLTAEALRDAFSSRKEILSLVSPRLNGSSCEPGPEPPVPRGGPARVSLNQLEASRGSNTEHLSILRNAFLNILASLGPMLKDDFVNRSYELSKEISACASIEAMGLLGDRIGAMVMSLINKAIERIDFSDDFLAELNKDLARMEEQLFSYQSHNKESHALSDDFHNDLLTHARDIDHAFDSTESLEDTRSLITSKISLISKAIEIKRQSDEVRLLEADTKISELQNNIKTYSREIIQVKERADVLEKEVLIDELTRINNRRAYDVQIRENLRRFHRDGESFSLVLIDVDHFKRVNDEYGHRAGDKCLQEIARLVKTSLRKTDFLARYGGEELIALLQGTNAGDAQNVAEKIRSRIEKTRFYFQDDIIPVTISLGVTEVAPGDKDTDIPFIRVDEAMYRAKQAGRNRVSVVTDLPIVQNAGSN